MAQEANNRQSHPLTTPEIAIGPKGNTYSATEYEVRVGAAGGYMGQIMLGVEIFYSIGAANTCDVQEEGRIRNIGVGTAHIRSGCTFFELDTNIQTLGNGQQVNLPGMELVAVIKEILDANEPKSSVQINPNVYISSGSLFAGDARIW